MTFTEKLDLLMEAKHLNKNTLSKACGIPYTTIDGWYKKGVSDLKLSTLRKLTAYFGQSLSFWLDNEEDPPEKKEPDIIHLIPQRVPLLGEIACGEPIFAQEDLSLMVDAPIECDFALRCKGDSMVDARILSGDLVFIRKQDVVDDGSIAAVLIDDEATLKRVYHLSDGRVELRAANVLYAPIIIGGEDETRTCRIIGKAVGFQSIFV